MEVTQGLVHVDSVELLHDTGETVVYRVNTREKRPEVISWNSNSLTVLPYGTEWFDVTPESFTVLRFPEKPSFISVYQEERYHLYFVQFSVNEDGEDVWTDGSSGV